MSEPPVYFAISTIAEAGFTDQLAQFTIFFKLGRSLNYLYFHTPLKATRSSSCTFDFVGLNQYLAKTHTPPLKKFRLFDLPISDEVLQDHHLSSFEDLQDYVSTVVAKARGQTTETLVVRFSICSGAELFLEPFIAPVQICQMESIS